MYKVSKLNPKKTATIVLILFYITGSGVCFAQNSYSNSSVAAPSAKERLNTKITYSCENLSMETMLKELSELGHVYFVKSPKVTGDVSISVVDVPLEEVLTNVLGAYDYTYIATENMIRVVPLSEAVILRETLITRIYKITYADVGEVTKALKEFLSINGKASFNKGTSHIIVTDTEDKIRAIDKFIDEIDRITSQVLVDVRIYDITSNEKFNIETQWNAQRNTPLKTTQHINSISNRSGMDTEKLLPYLDDILQRGETTTTEAGTHTSINEDWGIPLGVGPAGPEDWINDNRDTESFGTSFVTEDREFFGPNGENLTDWLNQDNSVRRSERFESYTTRRREPVLGASFNRTQGGTIRISLLNNAVDLDFALSMLHSQIEVKLLANPRILVLDNETANFEIIREVPYRELRQIAREDPITYTEFKKIGVQLKVTPHIARDGMIILKIEPEFGVIVGTDVVTGAPIVDTRRVKTTTLISDGQTIVLGGLRKKELKKSVDKMPFLGDLPLIGGLFRSETETEETNELVVFITTRIITNPRLTETEQIQYNELNFPSPNFSELKRLNQTRRFSEKQAAKRSSGADDFIKKWMQKAKATYPKY